jgi:prolycopene isomerase
MTINYDIVVVGAGNAGLTAAAASAKAGLKTLLLERHNIPGGSATSFRRGRFEFEPSLHEMAGYGSAENPGDVRNVFSDLGVDVQMLPVGDAFRTIVTGPDGYDVVMPVGIERFIGKMASEVPGSAESTANFFKLAGDVGRAMGYMAQGSPDPQVLMSEHINFMKVAAQPLGAVLDALHMPKKAQHIISTYWPYMGTPRGEFSFLLYSLMVYRYVSMTPYIPKMRSHELSLALLSRIHENGGDVWLNTEVSEFLIKDRRCFGVRTKDGLEIHAKHIISNVIPHRVFGAMVKPREVPTQELKRGNARKIGFSAFGVYLGLDKSPEELGIRDYSLFISSTPDSDELQKGMYTLDQNDFLIVNCLNIDNPGCSPKGTSILWFTQLSDAGAWDGVGPVNYKATKNRLAKLAIDRYETATGIKISDCIEEISIATPATFARYLDTPGGTIYGYHTAGWDSMLPRIMASREEQWIKGLSFCGGHGARTLGYSSTYVNGYQTGQMAAQAVKEEKNNG